MDNFFKIVNTSSKTDSRTGQLVTNHGTINTPCFLPVASQGSVKTLAFDDLTEIGVSMVLSNTYHLYLRPGIDTIAALGGLHRFMNWWGPILTDSGGYQVFSLSPLCKIADDGVVFRSHIDGSEHLFTPESVVSHQEKLGVDVIMTLDECISIHEDRAKVKSAMERTHKWAVRSKNQFSSNQLMFSIIQGGLFPDLRKESVEFLTAHDFHGYAIGGLSLGEPKETTWSIAEFTTRLLPIDKPRYLMGVGSPEDIVQAVSYGIDMFDSTLPTRVARNGALYTKEGRLNIYKSSFKNREKAFDKECNCYTCRNYSAAYLHHLFKAGELLALRLATIHNLYFLMCLMNDIRNNIQNNSYHEFKKSFLDTYKITDDLERIAQKKKWLVSRKSIEGN